MEGMAEKVIKLVLVLILAGAIFLYWLLPRTRLARRIAMNETLFVITCIVGIACGVIGLFVTLVWPQYIVELHLWELILIPFVLVNIYWAVIAKMGKSAGILDEKQLFDMTKAAAGTWGISITAMAILYLLYDRGIVHGVIWFPYYLFGTLLFYSASTLFYSKRA